MEEVAIALALRNPASTFVLTDSMTAYRNYLKGKISPLARRILSQAAEGRTEGDCKQVIWIPATVESEATS